ncbi:MAG: aminoacyl-tRNA hydrolase [Kiritimatiellae bacterium]|nr:aminoacyl-tRNA hydrolase [Kiritimatiellia bacterium]MDW8457637.1 aminoacyl-tRNA hydrolase [Verrucomicrobiota bacterium]
MKLIVGLGNPGREYEGTRHNVGFDVVDELARRLGLSFRKSWRFTGELAEGMLEGCALLLFKPSTFMNRSGEAVAPLVRKKGIAPADLIVAVDDVDLPLGRLRLRKSGGAGGHNGLKSLIAHLGTEAFPRVRIGIGRDAERDTVEHVLGRFGSTERPVIEEAIRRAADAIAVALREGWDQAMNRFN